MGDRITYVGLDVHKADIVVAVAEGGQRGEVREYGRIANTPAALDRVMCKLSGANVRLRVCYEAGPCGYCIRRHLSGLGHECVVCRHPRDRPRARRLHLGHRPARAAGGELIGTNA